MAARDRRFDGRFFVAVRTTGVYCAEERLQKVTDEHVAAIDAALKAKEAEIMEV